MDEKEFAWRVTQLRIQKGVSARDMSLSLGQCESYINKIENGYAMPSMTGFFYICEYFGITPEQFFSQNHENPALIDKAVREIEKLSEPDLKLAIEMLCRLNQQ